MLITRKDFLSSSVAAVMAALPVGKMQAPSGRPDIKSKLDSLRKMVLRFNDYLGDFGTYGSSALSPANNDMVIELTFGNVAWRASLCAGAAYSILKIYDSVSCEADRSKIRPTVEASLTSYAKALDEYTTTINKFVPDTNTSAIVTTALHMKDDLREAKALLESLESSLE